MTSYILGFLLPVIGIIMGIVVGVKGSAKHSAGVIILSFLSWGFWAATMM